MSTGPSLASAPCLNPPTRLLLGVPASEGDAPEKSPIRKVRAALSAPEASIVSNGAAFSNPLLRVIRLVEKWRSLEITVEIGV